MTVGELGHAISDMDLIWIPVAIAVYAFVAVAIYAMCQIDRRPPPRQPLTPPQPKTMTAEQWEAVKNYRSPAGYRNGVRQ